MNKILSCLLQLYFMRMIWIVFLTLGIIGCVQQPIWNNDLKSRSILDNHAIQAETLQNKETERVWKLEFREDFSGVSIGEEPESIFILDGEYTVQKADGTNKYLSLPGSPMGDFGLLFGPREREKPLELSFSFYASKKGRRMPSVAASIGGVRGYKLRLNPAARNLVLSMDETVFKEVPFSWKGEQWWKVRFQALTGDTNQTTRLQCKLWPKEQNEPNEWFVSGEFDIEYKGGKCALWGFPYSSTPILFDDLVIRSN